MPFSDTGGRLILAGMFPDRVTLAENCQRGDLLGYAGGWKLADGNAVVAATFIAGEPGIVGVKIAVWRMALVDGLAGGTAGGALYLSDTPGKYADSAGTSAQIVGRLASATAGWVDLRFGLLGLTNSEFDAGAVVAGSKRATPARTQHFTGQTVLDLSGAAQVEVVQFYSVVALTVTKVVLVYVEASSADAGVAVSVGKNASAAWFYTGNSEISKSLYYSKEVTLAHAALAAGEYITLSNAGGKVGTGNIQVHIEFTVDD